LQMKSRKLRRNSIDQTHFLQGNEACAEGAVAAGCRFYAAYPITPATEIAEHLARRLPPLGGIVIQMEDEMASMAAVLGASWAGAKAMTATSGPGFSLMQENLGLAFMTETPCVVVDVQRAGPSTGQATKCGQGDIMQARWGSHGDYNTIALLPNSVQEMFDLTIRAFNLAEAYRTPVVVLADEIIAHMTERANIPSLNDIEINNRRKPKPGDELFFGGDDIPPMPAAGEGFNVAVTGSTHDERGFRVTADPIAHTRLVGRLHRKIEQDQKKIAEYEANNAENCDIGVLSYGCTSRAAYEAVERAREDGFAVGHIRLKTMWPFPHWGVRTMAESAKSIVIPEMNLGQALYEVQRAVEGKASVIPLNKIGGDEMITPEEILAKIAEVS